MVNLPIPNSKFLKKSWQLFQVGLILFLFAIRAEEDSFHPILRKVDGAACYSRRNIVCWLASDLFVVENSDPFHSSQKAKSHLKEMTIFCGQQF